MKFQFLCKQDAINAADIKIVKEYTEDADAYGDIENTLLAYISDDLGEGKKQAQIANQSAKSIEDIVNDENLPYNHYIRVEDGVYYLYEKVKTEVDVSGWFGTSKVVKPVLKKLAMYTIISHNLEVYNYIPRCACNDKAKNSTKQSIESQSGQTFVEEMRNVFASLKPENGNIRVNSVLGGVVTKYKASTFRKSSVTDETVTDETVTDKVNQTIISELNDTQISQVTTVLKVEESDSETESYTGSYTDTDTDSESSTDSDSDSDSSTDTDSDGEWEVPSNQSIRECPF